MNRVTAVSVVCEPHRRLAELGIELPVLGEPAYSYAPVARHGDFLSVSGQISRGPDGVRSGVVGLDATVSDGAAAAEISALNLLSRINDAVGLCAVSSVFKLTVWVASAPDFTDQPEVAEAASALLLSVLGEAGRHARTALPVHVLPKGALVELDALVAVTTPPSDPVSGTCEHCGVAVLPNRRQ